MLLAMLQHDKVVVSLPAARAVAAGARTNAPNESRRHELAPAPRRAFAPRSAMQCIRVSTFSCTHRWQMMIEDEFPFVSLCLPIGFKQNPSSQDGLVKLSSLMTIMIFALLSAFIFSNWLCFGACMIVRLLFIQLSLLLPVLVSQVDLRLIVLNQLTTMLVKCEKYFVKNCLKNIVDFVNMTMKYIVYLYSIVKKTVVVETVSKSAGATKSSTTSCNYNLFSRCTKSSVVLLSYATLIAISQSTGKHHFQIYMKIASKGLQI